jgi:hypothetical protein
MERFGGRGACIVAVGMLTLAAGLGTNYRMRCRTENPTFRPGYSPILPRGDARRICALVPAHQVPGGNACDAVSNDTAFFVLWFSA